MNTPHREIGIIKLKFIITLILKITPILILVSLIIYTAETISLWAATYVVLGVILFGIYLKCEGYD